MLKEMKEQIIEAFEKAMKSGEIKAEQVRDIVQKTVSDTAGKVKEGGITLREIAREASTTATDGLKQKGPPGSASLRQSRAQLAASSPQNRGLWTGPVKKSGN